MEAVFNSNSNDDRLLLGSRRIQAQQGDVEQVRTNDDVESLIQFVLLHISSLLPCIW